jgi:twitching motility protein PilT
MKAELMNRDGEVPSVPVQELLGHVLAVDASDLHVTVGAKPTVRIHGDLKPLEQYDILEPDQVRRMIYAILTQRQRERLEQDLELDLSYSLPGKGRFRVNVYFQRDAVGAAFRFIPFVIRTVEELGLPPQAGDFARLPRGLVLVTGPTGSTASEKSTS